MGRERELEFTGFIELLYDTVDVVFVVVSNVL
jgi:hypothetical protein